MKVKNGIPAGGRVIRVGETQMVSLVAARMLKAKMDEDLRDVNGLLAAARWKEGLPYENPEDPGDEQVVRALVAIREALVEGLAQLRPMHAYAFACAGQVVLEAHQAALQNLQGSLGLEVAAPEVKTK